MSYGSTNPCPDPPHDPLPASRSTQVKEVAFVKGKSKPDHARGGVEISLLPGEVSSATGVGVDTPTVGVAQNGST